MIPAPTSVEWRTWQQAILQTTLVGRNLSLPLPLGKWCAHKVNQPGWFYDTQENALYHRTIDGVTRHGIIPRRSRAQAFHTHGEATQDHPAWANTQIATVRTQGDKVILTGMGKFLPSHPLLTQRWFQNMAALTLGVMWNLQLRHSGSMEHLQQAIGSAKALAVSNGLYQNNCGACTWIIEGETADDCIEGSMQTPGQPGDHSSFRSEVAGIYGTLLTLWYFSQEYPVTGTITLACDGQSVLDRLQSTKTIDPFAAHVDLLRACRSIMRQLTFQVHYSHVKGHQDSGQTTVLSCKACIYRTKIH